LNARLKGPSDEYPKRKATSATPSCFWVGSARTFRASRMR
jgi:hypothetical protein